MTKISQNTWSIYQYSNKVNSELKHLKQINHKITLIFKCLMGAHYHQRKHLCEQWVVIEKRFTESKHGPHLFAHVFSACIPIFFCVYCNEHLSYVRQKHTNINAITYTEKKQQSDFVLLKKFNFWEQKVIIVYMS